MTSATDNRTTERVDHSPRVREAIDELMREKDATDNRTTELLTAEQVREAVEASTWAETSTIREFNDSSWQAIADELNARAERTCRIVEYADAPIPVCSECGAVQPDDYAVYYCWSCGAKVRNE